MKGNARKGRRGRVVGPMVVAGLAAWINAGYGDDAPPAAPDAPVPLPAAEPAPAALASAPAGDQGATQIAEVVVTATKRKQSLRDIPASITSISGEDLERRNAQSTQDIVKLVPGVNYTENADGPPRVTVRGISAQPATSFTTGVLFGDVSFTDQYIPLVALDPNPFDLKSVDVLKGPQGTLFGAASLNGAIRYVPNQPRFQNLELKYFGEYSRFTDSAFKPEYGAALNVPVGETLALRVTGFERETPGYVDNLKTGEKASNHVNQAGLRGILAWQPLDSLEVKFTYAWQNTHIADASTTDNPNGELSSNVRPRLSPQRTAYSLADLNLGYDFDWARVVSESAFVRKQMHNYFDASSRLPGDLPIAAQIYGANSDTWTQELRLVSPEDKTSNWQWVTGLYWSRQKVFDRLDITAGNAAIPTGQILDIVNMLIPGLTLEAPNGDISLISTASSVTVREAAFFADVTRRFWQQVELTLGGRLYKTNSGGINDLTGALTLLRGSSSIIDQATVDEKGFNPHASLLWHITPDALVYAATAKGFRVGGVQSGAVLLPTEQIPPSFHSDTIWNYETGVRTQWFHKTLHLDLTGFLERWKEPQYLQPDQTGLISFVSNVGGVKSEGGEVALQWLAPIKGLMLSASGAYANTVTTKLFIDSSNNPVPVGTRWPFSSRWQTASTVAYAHAFGPWEVNTAVTHIYLGKAINNLTRQAPVFGYQQWDGTLSLSNAELKWLPECTFAINNAFNSRGLINHVYATGVQNYADYLYTQPRAITLRLSGHF